MREVYFAHGDKLVEDAEERTLDEAFWGEFDEMLAQYERETQPG